MRENHVGIIMRAIKNLPVEFRDEEASEEPSQGPDHNMEDDSDEDENIPGPDEDYVPVTPKHLLPLMNPFPSEDDDLALEELMEQLEAEIAEEVKHEAVERVRQWD